MNLDKSFPYARVMGHEKARYEQGGVLFDENEEQIKDRIIAHDGVENAKAFITKVLESGPKSKSMMYAAAAENNQPWLHVKAASSLMNLVKYKFHNAEFWKLSEEA